MCDCEYLFARMNVSVKYIQSVSRWGFRYCRWWQGLRNRPRCTTAHCHTAWCCWWRACRYCWCIHHSCSCPVLALRYPMPTWRWSPAHLDPKTDALNLVIHSFQCIVHSKTCHFFNVFKKSLYYSPRLHLFDEKYSKNNTFVKYYNLCKSGNAEFSASLLQYSFIWTFRTHSNMLVCC